jgi:hypothetical protein
MKNDEHQRPQEAALWAKYTESGKLEIHSHIPEGIKIGMGKHGRTMIATKFFPKGTVVYRAYSALVRMGKPAVDSYQDVEANGKVLDQKSVSVHTANTVITMSDEEESIDATSTSVSQDDSSMDGETTDYKLYLYRADGSLLETVACSDVHSVQDVTDPTDNVRQVYGFDCYMDHSCEPNTHCPLVSRSATKMCYDCHAIRDIHPGDQITCDYDAFEWEADGHQIPQCGCGSKQCRGKVMGFKNLSLTDKVRLMPYCEQEILDQFFQENPHVILCDSKLPKGIALVEDDVHHELSLVTTKSFQKGEEVYTNTSTLIPKEHLHTKKFVQQIYIQKIGNDRFVLLDPNHHFIHRECYVEHVGFDSFQDHSCDPNTRQAYQSANKYTVWANRFIAAGERLTIDYGKLDNELCDEPHIPSAWFTCHCGSVNCRGRIEA